MWPFFCLSHRPYNKKIEKKPRRVAGKNSLLNQATYSLVEIMLMGDCAA